MESHLHSLNGYSTIAIQLWATNILNDQLADNQRRLEAENQQLLSWGIGAGTVADMLETLYK